MRVWNGITRVSVCLTVYANHSLYKFHVFASYVI